MKNRSCPDREGCVFYRCSECETCDMGNRILNLNKKISRLKAKTKWISVEDRLPEENGRYLVCVAIRHLVFEDLTMVVIMGYNKTNGFDVVSGEETVTHWMPLPKAPKKKGGE